MILDKIGVIQDADLLASALRRFNIPQWLSSGSAKPEDQLSLIQMIVTYLMKPVANDQYSAYPNGTSPTWTEALGHLSALTSFQFPLHFSRTRSSQ